MAEDDTVSEANAPASSPKAAAASHGSVRAARAASAGESPEARALGAYEALSRSAKLPDLVALTREVVDVALSTRLPDAMSGSKVKALAETAKLSREDAATPYGNALKVLESGPEDAAERALAQALYAHVVAEMPRGKSEAEAKLAGDVLWLATHTSFDATPLLDRALGEDSADVWSAIANRVARIDAGRGGALGRGEALVGCAALSTSTAEAAASARKDLKARVTDSVLLRVLGGEEASGATVRLDGETIDAPRGPVVTALLAVTGILLVMRGVALVGRLALAYKRPAEIDLTPTGIRIRTRTSILGRVLRDREAVIARSSLAQVVREVRYPRAAFYAGLLALAVGSFFGVRALVDGARAASPSLLLVGLAILATGIALDFVLGTLLPGARGHCRIGFVPRTGKPLWVGGVDVARADEALARALAPR